MPEAVLTSSATSDDSRILTDDRIEFAAAEASSSYVVTVSEQTNR